MLREIPESLVEGMRGCLGKNGTIHFKRYLKEHGTVSPVINMGGIPHPVHFREGMQVRNFMRKLPDCEGWSDIDLDDTWAELVLEAIGTDDE